MNKAKHNKKERQRKNIEDEAKKTYSLSSKINALMKNIKKTHSLRQITSFMKIFRSVLNDENEEKIVIDEGDLFNEIMQFSLTHLPDILKNILNLPEELKNYAIKNKKLEIVLKVFLLNLYKFLCKLHDEEMIIFLLKLLPNLCELIIITNKVLRIKYVKLFIDFWSTNESIVVKLNSFLLIRRIATLFPSDLEAILKKTYVSFVKNAKSMNWRNYELVTFMINCYNELLSLDFNISYMIAFQYINQKAQMMKKYFKEKNEKNIHNIYNWQFVNSLKLWMKAITTHSNELGELTFPLIYICEGIFTLYPIPKFFPLFIQILQELNNVSKVLGIYIPSVKTAIFTLLGSKEFFKKKSNKKPKAFDFDIHIKAQKEYILTNAFWNSTFNEILDLIIEFLAIHSKTIFFPELTNFVVYQLKKHQKKYTFNFYKMKIKLILQKIQENKEKVWEKRKTFKKSVVKKTECLEFKAMKEKSSLEKEFERIHEEKENMRKQKILAEKEDGTNEEDSNLSEEENDIDELSQGKYDEDNEKPLSEEEDLDLE